MKKEYKTAVDSFFVIWPMIILIIQTLFFMTSLQYANTVIVVIFGVLTLMITVFLLAVATTKYMITLDVVVIQNLLYSKAIKLSEITKWKVCENSISIFAASTKQVELVTEERTIRISPAKRDEFIEFIEAYKKFEMVV